MKTQQTNISEVRLVYRTKVKASDRPQVKCSKDAFDIFMESWDLDSIEHIEEFKLMLLTRSNKVLGIASILSIPDQTTNRLLTINQKRVFNIT